MTNTSYQPHGMEAHVKIVSMQLGGFQTISEVVEIPLGKLAFLFGPNSAGKSAVEDALKLFFELVLDDRIQHTGIQRENRITQHLRKLNGDDHRHVVEKLTLGVTIETDHSDFVSVHADHLADIGFGGWARHKPPHLVSYCFEFTTHVNTEERMPRLGQSIIVSINSILLFKLTFFDGITINFGHPFFDDRRAKKKYRDAAVKWPDFFNIVHGEVTLHGSVSSSYGILSFDDYGVLGDAKQKAGSDPEIDLEARNFITVFTSLHDSIREFYERQHEYSVVHASRTIPTREDLTFFHDIKPEHADNHLRDVFSLPRFGDPTYKELSEALVAAKVSMSGYGCPGSWPPANSFLASSRFALASFRPVSG